uniref:Uncharacterized protein n=1 Tax=Cucumis sativus TaxID=3659 RepID=A0A0A0L4H5_CUCSA
MIDRFCSSVIIQYLNDTFPNKPKKQYSGEPQLHSDAQVFAKTWRLKPLPLPISFESGKVEEVYYQ